MKATKGEKILVTTAVACVLFVMAWGSYVAKTKNEPNERTGFSVQSNIWSDGLVSEKSERVEVKPGQVWQSTDVYYREVTPWSPEESQLWIDAYTVLQVSNRWARCAFVYTVDGRIILVGEADIPLGMLERMTLMRELED